MGTCTAERCDRPAIRRGYCKRDYTRLLRTGTTAPRPRPTPAERFAAKTARAGACLIWTAHLNRNGYGQFSVNGKTVLAHRWAWEQEHGPIPPGKVLDHTCRNRACVDVAHLEAVTHTTNVRRGRAASRRAASCTCPCTCGVRQ